MSNEHKRATNSGRQGQGKWLMRVAEGRIRWHTGRMSDMNSHVGVGAEFNPSADSCCCHPTTKSEESFGWLIAPSSGLYFYGILI